MDLSTALVSFKDAAGVVQESRLAVAEAGALAAGRPWRVFRWHRGQAHYSGWYWSATMGRHVVYESRLELARLLLADFDRQVTAIAAQPFLVTALAEDGRTRRRVPDFLLVDGGGLVTVVNVKPADRLGDPKVAQSLEWAGTLFESRGWRHEVWSQAPPAVLANVRFLAAYRHQARVPAELADRLGHVRELLTGYASGSDATAAEGEPRPQYDPSLPAGDREAAKAAELGVSARTVRRWAAGYLRGGAAGLVDGRSVRPSDVLAGVDERWLAMCKIVLGEHTEASRPTRNLVLRRVSARLEAEHGPGTVREPGVKKARAVLGELTRGTNTFAGSTKAKRSIAARPAGVYGRLRATRPGEYVLLDTTPLDVFAMEPVTLRWVRVELTVAMDLFSRCITGLRLSPVSTKAVDAAAVLFETLHPSRHGTAAGLLPYAGLPDVVVTGESSFPRSGPGTARRAGALAGVAAETVVVDHGKIYLSEHLMAVCERLGISVQPARPLTPTDKAAIERFFRTLSEGLLAALPGYKGPDVYSRGADPEGCAYFFTSELEQVIREWVSIYHRRAHAGLAEPQVPGLELSPAEMFEAGAARTGRLRIPAHPGLAFDFLPVTWRTIQHYGVEMGGLRYDGPALTRYRNRKSPFTGEHAGKWPVRFDPDDVSKAYFQDPADNTWHELAWEHADAGTGPFSAEALACARRLALAEGRHVDERRALAELLDRWDAGLVRHPAERRMAVRASEQRAARLAAADPAAEVAALPTAAALTAAQDMPRPEPGGDDDSPGELDAGDDFYADVFEVLP